MVTFSENLFHQDAVHLIRHLRASTVTVFIYLQPLIAGIFAIIMGSDAVTVVKILASALIFLGVYLVTKKPKLQA